MRNIRLYILLALSLALLFSCEKGEGDTEKENPPYDLPITAIAINDNIVWVGTYTNGLYKLQGELVTHYTHSNGLLSDTIRSLAIDNNANLWIGTNMGISKFKNENWTNFTTTDGLFSNDIRCLACDLANNIWIGTRKNRLLKYNGTNFAGYHVNPDASGIGELGHIHTITCDPDGNIWVGSCISGLSKFDGENWVDNINDLNVFVSSSICTEDGDLWIGHYTGAYKLSNDVWTRYTTDEGLVDNDVTCFAIDLQDNLWIGTANGLSRYDGAIWTNYTKDNGLINNSISALACDQNGDIWIGGGSGLIKDITLK